MKKYNNRNEVPENYKWDLSDFFGDEEEFENKLKECKKNIDKLKKYVGCTKDSAKLYEFLKLEIEVIADFEDLYVYSFLINDQELGLPKSLERNNKVENLNVALETNISFFAPELLKLSNAEYENLFNDNKKLLEFKFSLDKIYREKEHILSENEEKIISELTISMNNYENISSTLLNAEHNYGKVKLEDGTEEIIATTNYRKLMKNKNRNIRKKVYNSYNKVIDQYSTTSASLLNGYINMNNSLAKIRKYESSWQEKLFSINITEKVYDSLKNAVENNLGNLHKYYELKKRALGLNELHVYDLSLDMAKLDKEYSIEDAQRIVRNSIKPLGDNYLEKFNKIINNRHIDYCQYKGKCSGGYCASSMRKDSRILLSFNGNFESISTIAHEAGHDVHHQIISENNPLQYRFPSTIISEVASLTNECLLSKYILENSDNHEEKKIGLENIIGVIVSNLYGAVREGKIEQEMYDLVLNGGMLTKEFLDNKTKESLKKYYGPSVNVDDNIKNGWVTRSHYFMHFYLYSYAICISVAINVANKILQGDKNMLENYHKFLMQGSDIWPLDAFKVLGIDLEDQKVYVDATEYLGYLINEYNKILDLEEKSYE